MSLQNPNLVREQSSQKRSPLSLILAMVFACLVFAAGAATGMGFAIVANQFRVMAMNSVFDWDTTDFAQWPLPLFGGIIGGLIMRALYTNSLRRWSGGLIRIGPTFFTMLGVAAGFFVYSMNWTAPTAVGHSVDTVFGGSEAWGIGAWVMYFANFWVPALCVLIAVIALVARLIFAVRVSQKMERVHHAVAQGHQVQGRVDSAIDTGIRVNNQPVVRFVVSFTDPAGQTRWVTKQGAFNHAQMPRAGDVAQVFFDPATIDNEKTIAVGLGDTQSAGPASSTGTTGAAQV